MPVMPREKWDSKEQYLEYLRHLAAYKIFAKEYIYSKKSVLEIGCGTGYGANYLSKFTTKVIAVDISRENVVYCKEHNKNDNIIFIIADGTKLPFQSNRFDVVIPFQVIEHINPKTVMSYLLEIKRVLKEGGIFLCSTPNKKLRLLPFQKPWNPEHKKEYNCKELKNLLSKVFEEVVVYGLVASEDVLSLERKRVKQNPFKVYIVKPFYWVVKNILPNSLLVRLKRNVGSNKHSKKKQRLVEQEFLAEFSLKNFAIDQSCPDDCLDLLGICRARR